jgi:hypothetical protein
MCVYVRMYVYKEERQEVKYDRLGC